MSIYEEGLAEAYVRIRSKGDSGTEWVTAVRRSNGEVSVLCGEPPHWIVAFRHKTILAIVGKNPKQGSWDMLKAWSLKEVER
jgi:hypothetical protein